MKTARPFVLINIAMSADGKIAPTHRRFVAFGSRRDHANLLSLRATADAVMCGARTVDSAAVTLDAGSAAYERRRVRAGLARQNLRIVVSGSGSVDPGAAIFRHPGSPLIVLSSGQAPKSRLAKLKRLADCVKVCGKNRVALGQALGQAGKRLPVQLQPAAKPFQAPGRGGQRPIVAVEPHQPPVRAAHLEDRLRMSAAADRAIHVQPARRRLKRRERFLQQNRFVDEFGHKSSAFS
jgi:hypothetical protein